MTKKNTRDCRIDIRVSSEERNAMKVCALQCGQTLSSWLRDIATRESRRLGRRKA